MIISVCTILATFTNIILGLYTFYCDLSNLKLVVDANFASMFSTFERNVQPSCTHCSTIICSPLLLQYVQ